MKKLFCICTCLFLAAFSLKAQDKIYRKNGKVLEAKIIEIGSTDIKYKELSDPDGPVYVLETDRVKKVVTADGKEHVFSSNLKDTESYGGELTKAIKINFFSPLYGYTEFGYEKSVGVGRSIEFSLGFIGLGKSESLSFYDGLNYRDVKRKQAGAFVSGGYKFNKLPDFIFFGRTRMSHIMQGTYFKPVVYVGHYSENIINEKTATAEVDKQNVTFGAIQLELGKQRVFGDKVVLDTYIGFGYGFDNKKDSYQYGGTYSDTEGANNYANARVGNSPSLSFSFGLKLGLLVK